MTESGSGPRSTCSGGHAAVLITILSCLWLATHQTAPYPTVATATTSPTPRPVHPPGKAAGWVGAQGGCGLHPGQWLVTRSFPRQRALTLHQDWARRTKPASRRAASSQLSRGNRTTDGASGGSDGGLRASSPRCSGCILQDLLSRQRPSGENRRADLLLEEDDAGDRVWGKLEGHSVQHTSGQEGMAQPERAAGCSPIGCRFPGCRANRGRRRATEVTRQEAL